MKVIGLDFETVKVNNVHRFLSFQVYTEDFPGLTGVYYDKESIFRVFNKATGGAIVGVFNLAFDGVLLSELLDNYVVSKSFDCGHGRVYDVYAYLSGSSLKSIKVVKGRLSWKVFDLQNIFNVRSLEKLSRIVGCPKLPKPPFLGERPPLTEEERRQFEQYALRDSEVCYRALKMVQSELGTVRSTASGIAARVFKRDFAGRSIYNILCDEDEAFVRRSYRGGRTEALWRGAIDAPVYAYDVISMHPYVMSSFPYPDVRRPPRERLGVDLDREGFAECLIVVDHDVPPVGVKAPAADGQVKLIFPEGKIYGVFTYPELRHIEEEGVGKVAYVARSLEWREAFNPFRDYVRKYYELKRRCEEEGSPKRELYKLMLNSLYGKFGERGRIRRLTLRGRSVVGDVEVPLRRRWYHNVALSSYIAAYARLHLWGIMKAIGFEHIVYCDTDSAFTTRPAPSLVGRELGQLKLEGEARAYESVFIKSKFYIFKDRVAMKGFALSMRPEQVMMLIASGELEVLQRKILKMLEASRRCLPPLLEAYYFKEFDVNEDGKRIYERSLSPRQLIMDCAQSQPIRLNTLC